jgi:UDP-glucose:(heptosyl)LPS alpha-1,3-glucosyltransferase
MKIGLVSKQYTLKKGGLEKYTIFLSRELVHAGHEVHVFTNNWQANADITIHQVPMIPFSLPLKNLSFAYFSKQLLKKTELDIVHSMERILYQDIYRASDGIIPVHLEQRYSNPTIRWFKSIGPRRLALTYLEKKIFLDKGCKIVMANSHLVKRHIIQYYHVHPKRIKVIYNAINTSIFRPDIRKEYRNRIRKMHGIDEKEILLLFISNDHKRKGLMNLLKAIHQLEKRNIKVMVLGKDTEKPYTQWAEKNLLREKILFLGQKEDVQRYYAAADIFVLPTRYDAFANVCLEAMACGLPVITTRNNGASELIQDGEHGFVLNGQEPDELAGRIEALRFPKARTCMGEKAAKKAKDFSMEKHISEVLNLYDQVRGQGYA